MVDLKRLTRDRLLPAMARSVRTVLHVIDGDQARSTANLTPEDLARDEVELLATLVGTDDTSLQPVHARHRYLDGEILCGRPARRRPLSREQTTTATSIMDVLASFTRSSRRRRSPFVPLPADGARGDVEA